MNHRPKSDGNQQLYQLVIRTESRPDEQIDINSAPCSLEWVDFALDDSSEEAFGSLLLLDKWFRCLSRPDSKLNRTTFNSVTLWENITCSPASIQLIDWVVGPDIHQKWSDFTVKHKPLYLFMSLYEDAQSWEQFYVVQAVLRGDNAAFHDE